MQENKHESPTTSRQKQNDRVHSTFALSLCAAIVLIAVIIVAVAELCCGCPVLVRNTQQRDTAQNLGLPQARRAGTQHGTLPKYIILITTTHILPTAGCIAVPPRVGRFFFLTSSSSPTLCTRKRSGETQKKGTAALQRHPLICHQIGEQITIARAAGSAAADDPTDRYSRGAL